MISSSQNPKLKRVRRLLSDRRFRRREQAFVVEGTRWLAEVVASGRQPEIVLVTESWLDSPGNEPLVARLSLEVTMVAEKVMSAASDTESPAGVLAVMPMIDLPLPDNPTLLLILDRVSDPGNLGAMVRTAAAAGADGLLLGPGCVDPYNPKAIRATMGALLRMPVLSHPWPTIQELTAGLAVWQADASGSMDYSQVDWRRPAALVVGSEARGIGAEARLLGGGSIAVPMAGQAESLNAAAAAAIILFEARRQRSRAP
ncbi:MAG TPA: RNA methyltransferase [Anaerolineae bacterium]|jgi:TrmH family RNA methyltransferase|nr:RNA methyltransferase [Anaerolineae bacterium]